VSYLKSTSSKEIYFYLHFATRVKVIYIKYVKTMLKRFQIKEKKLRRWRAKNFEVKCFKPSAPKYISSLQLTLIYLKMFCCCRYIWP